LEATGSLLIGSRQTWTFAIPTLSSAQPVTGMAPATPVVLSRGVSKLPMGLPRLVGLRIRMRLLPLSAM
jgi:hypothetical protein